jgi:hypothetical protein
MLTVGVEPGFISVVDEGEDGFVPCALGTLAFSSDFLERDSASESVSSCHQQCDL